MTQEITVDFIGNDKSLSRTANAVEGRTGRLGSTLGKISKMAAVGFAAVGAAAIGAGVKLFQMGDDALDARDRIGQIAESMGLFGKHADDVTNRLVKYADATARATGMDQNAIKATQAKLLTFKELAKSADETGGAFDRATKAAIDLEAAGFGDAASNAVQLGKALNDPIKGLTALTRSGITFTEAEQKRIKAMVEGGKTGQAQAKILKAIEAQVGGTAEAMAGPFDRLKVTLSQLAERIGMRLVPVVESLSQWFLDKGLPAMMKFGAYLEQRLPPIFEKIQAVVSRVLDAINGDAGGFMSDLKGIFKDAVSIVQSIWKHFGKNIVGFLKGWVKSIAQIFKGVFQVIKGLFKVFASVLKGDWKGVWQGIKEILKGVANIIIGLIKNMWNTIKFAFKNAGVILKGVFRAIWDGIKSLARSGAEWIVDLIKGIPGRIAARLNMFREVGKKLINALMDGIKNAAGFASGFATQIWDAVRSTINAGIDKLNSLLEFDFKVKGVGFTVNAPDIGHLARGTDNWRGGLAVVGEEGPELVNLPRGSRVTPHGESMGRLRALDGEDGRPLVVQLVMDGSVIEQVMIRQERRKGRPLAFRTLGPS